MSGDSGDHDVTKLVHAKIEPTNPKLFLLERFVEFLIREELDQGPEWCEEVLNKLPKFLEEYGAPYIIRKLREPAFGYQHPEEGGD